MGKKGRRRGGVGGEGGDKGGGEGRWGGGRVQGRNWEERGEVKKRGVGIGGGRRIKVG